MSLTLFHVTTEAAAGEILLNGFVDGKGRYGLTEGEPLTGVFISNRPLSIHEGTKGDTALRLVLDVEESAIADYEIVEESLEPGDETAKPYREWFLPAALLNAHAQVERFVESDEVLEMPEMPQATEEP